MVHGLHDVRAPGEKVEMTAKQKMVVDSLLEQLNASRQRGIWAGRAVGKIPGPLDKELATMHEHALKGVLGSHQAAHKAIRAGDYQTAARQADQAEFWARAAVTTANNLMGVGL